MPSLENRGGRLKSFTGPIRPVSQPPLHIVREEIDRNHEQKRRLHVKTIASRKLIEKYKNSETYAV